MIVSKENLKEVKQMLLTSFTPWEEVCNTKLETIGFILHIGKQEIKIYLDKGYEIEKVDNQIRVLGI